MINFSEKTAANIQQAQLRRVAAQIDKREGSLIQTALGPASYALEEAYMELAQVQANGFVQTAVTDALDYKVAEGGLTRTQATAAMRRGIFNIDVPLGGRFSGGGQTFRAVLRESAGQYQMQCEAAGAQGNHYTGALTAITYVEGLTAARLDEILIPGEDAEEDDALRARYVDYVRDKPFGGNVAEYRMRIMAMDGIGGVRVYPVWNGGGTVKCSIVGADFLPASTTLLGAVQTALDPEQTGGQGLGLAPIGAYVTVARPEVVTVNVAATVTVAANCTIEQLRAAITAALEVCFAEQRAVWAGETISTIYRARLIAAMLSVSGVLNVEGLTLGGADADLPLTQTSALQQQPILGEVTLLGN